MNIFGTPHPRGHTHHQDASPLRDVVREAHGEGVVGDQSCPYYSLVEPRGSWADSVRNGRDGDQVPGILVREAGDGGGSNGS